MFEVENVYVKYGKNTVLHNVNVNIKKGRVVCLLGPNGSGKTTLFKVLLGILTPVAGAVKLDGKKICRYNCRELARKVAYVPQIHIPVFPYTVIDVVCTGRTSHYGMAGVPDGNDTDICLDILNEMGIFGLKDKNYTEISGGERQLVLIARALAQQPQFIIMDEPTAHLDYGNQIRTIERISQMTNDNVGVIFTTHNPEHPLICAHDVIAIKNGTIEACGCPDHVVSADIIKRLYNIDAVVCDKRVMACCAT